MRYSYITGRISPCFVPIRLLAVADEVQLSDDETVMCVGKMRGVTECNLKNISSLLTFCTNARGMFGTSCKNLRCMSPTLNLVGRLLEGYFFSYSAAEVLALE